MKKRRKSGKLQRIFSVKNVVIIGGLAALISGSSYFLFKDNYVETTEIHEKLNFGEWYDRYVVDKSGEKFLHTWVGLKPLHDDEISDLEDKIILDIENQLGDVTLKLTSKGRYKQFQRLNITPYLFQDYSIKLQKAISEFLGDLRLETPELNFNRITPHTNVEFPNKGEINFYIAWQQTDAVQVVYRIIGTTEQIEAERLTNNHRTGEINSEMTITPIGESIIIESFRGPAIITVGSGKVGAYGSTLAESLHYVLSPSRVKHIGNDLEQKWEAAGYPLVRNELNQLIIPPEFCQETLLKWKKREEGLVHHLVHDRLYKIMGEEGLPLSEVRGYIQLRLGSDTYSEISTVAEKTGGMRPHQIMELWMNNPEILFRP